MSQMEVHLKIKFLLRKHYLKRFSKDQFFKKGIFQKLFNTEALEDFAGSGIVESVLRLNGSSNFCSHNNVSILKYI